ncbi:hypothetical protein GCM10009665_49560 [Kitasatospora nipponensis]|uniref:Uncharacterized protein n=1 Tax=Kitasatospora nipponensis TaxID=258049 RepID=A0ABN1WKS1_9ACTN
MNFAIRLACLCDIADPASSRSVTRSGDGAGRSAARPSGGRRYLPRCGPPSDPSNRAPPSGRARAARRAGPEVRGRPASVTVKDGTRWPVGAPRDPAADTVSRRAGAGRRPQERPASTALEEPM